MRRQFSRIGLAILAISVGAGGWACATRTRDRSNVYEPHAVVPTRYGGMAVRQTIGDNEDDTTPPSVGGSEFLTQAATRLPDPPAGPFAPAGESIEDPSGASVGVMWVGEMGITETVAEIMARAPRDLEFDPTGIRKSDKPQRIKPDRRNLPQNPNSPAVSQWPPPAAGGNPEGEGSSEAPSLDGGSAPDANEPGDMPGVDLPQSPDENTPLDDERRPPGWQQPYLPQTIGTSILGAQISDTVGFIPPDSMGSVGPTQVIVFVNGRIRSFNKTTGAADGALNTTADSFFNSVRAGFSTSDPQIRFDRLSNRWYAAIINVASINRVLIAVSSGPIITSTASFTFFFFQHDQVGTTPNADTNGFADYPSLGVDLDALYIGVNVFNPGFTGSTGFVVRKTSITGGGPIVAFAFRQLCVPGGAGPYSPRGVDNDDSASTQGYFIGVDNQLFNRLAIRRVSTPGGTPTISGNILLTVPTTVFPIAGTPCLGSATPLSALDDRLFAAQMRRNTLTNISTLWTAHNIQTTNAGVASNSGGRNSSRWYEIQNLTATPSLRQSGTLFDNAATNPFSYWIPSCMMSGQGHMALGCSVAGTTRRAEIAAAGRLSSDALGTIQAPTTVQTSATNYNAGGGNPQSWGDYSFVSVDPVDNMTMWSAQEYCNANNSWGVRMTKLIAPPPATPVSCSPPNVAQGFSGNVVVTGTSASGSGFYDPPNLPAGGAAVNHIAASVSGAGVTVNSVTFTNPTSITLNITVAGGATPGLRNVTVTNPDGQMATGNNLLTIDASCPPITLAPPSLPDGTEGSAYGPLVITASGGTSPYTFFISAGALPGGMTLAPDGTLSGPPSASGLFNFTVTAEDSSVNACTGSQAYSLLICPVVTVNPASLPDGTVGVAYSQTITASPVGSYTFAVTSGALPPPLMLNSGTGDITGTPNTAGPFNFTITATDGDGCEGSRAYSINIAPGAGCPLMADLNGDGNVDGLDISHFTNCLLTGGSPGGNCACGDMNGSGAVDNVDTPLFVNALL